MSWNLGIASLKQGMDAKWDSAGQNSNVELFPGHALHEKGLQRQIGVGTLVSSQERRALFVPRIYRGLTAGFVPPSVLSTN